MEAKNFYIFFYKKNKAYRCLSKIYDNNKAVNALLADNDDFIYQRVSFAQQACLLTHQITENINKIEDVLRQKKNPFLRGLISADIQQLKIARNQIVKMLQQFDLRGDDYGGLLQQQFTIKFMHEISRINFSTQYISEILY